MQEITHAVPLPRVLADLVYQFWDERYTSIFLLRSGQFIVWDCDKQRWEKVKCHCGFEIESNCKAQFCYDSASGEIFALTLPNLPDRKLRFQSCPLKGDTWQPRTPPPALPTLHGWQVALLEDIALINLSDCIILVPAALALQTYNLGEDGDFPYPISAWVYHKKEDNWRQVPSLDYLPLCEFYGNLLGAPLKISLPPIVRFEDNRNGSNLKLGDDNEEADDLWTPCSKSIPSSVNIPHSFVPLTMEKLLTVACTKLLPAEQRLFSLNLKTGEWTLEVGIHTHLDRTACLLPRDDGVVIYRAELSKCVKFTWTTTEGEWTESQTGEDVDLMNSGGVFPSRPQYCLAIYASLRL